MKPLLPLPIDAVLGEVVARVRDAPALVLHAPPGAGKTTRVPPALSQALGTCGRTLVLQPRRVAARSAAARIAAEQGWRLGEEVGYQVRFESRVSPRTRVAIITEGILLRRLLDDPFLEGVAAVIFDEFHERSLASDLALAMVRQIQQAVRPDLRIVVMSATLAAEPVARYLGGCPVVASQGRMFPVDVRYVPHSERLPLAERVAQAVESVLDQTTGDCLVFLPGVGEIRQCARRLEAFCSQHALALLELYGDLPADQQDAVLSPGPSRKVILSTNVAETSLTIEGVTAVVDSGLARVLRYDERTGLDHLVLQPIAQAAAEQRAGRAGRTQPGVCLRLWSEAAHRSRPALAQPEIERVDLAGAVLQVLCWIEPELASFPWFEPPPPGAVERAGRLLEQLELAAGGAVTPLGRVIARLPVHPRVGRLLVEGQRLGQLAAAATAAALLTERDPFVRPPGRAAARATSQSDVLDRVERIEAFAAGQRAAGDEFVSGGAAKQVLRVREQLVRLVQSAEVGSVAAPAMAPAESDPLLVALLRAYPDRVARRREPGGRRALMVGGRGVRLADESAVRDAELFLCIDVEGAGSEALVRQASAIAREWLPPERVREVTECGFDATSGKIIARRRVYYDDLLLAEAPAALPEADAVAQALADAATERLAEVLPPADSPAGNFRARVQCLRAWMPELGLPPLDDGQLAALLPQLARGRRSLDELRAAPWLAAMQDLLTWPQRQAVDREAPERIEVPSGSRIAIQYEPGRPPILAVRIQEIFGLAETPRIAGGRVPVLLHLLAPSMRVAQVTGDLAGFWAGTYAQVRKDLKARYPKHAWPEDPAHAAPQRRPGRRP